MCSDRPAPHCEIMLSHHKYHDISVHAWSLAHCTASVMTDAIVSRATTPRTTQVLRYMVKDDALYDAEGAYVFELFLWICDTS
jgi:hypothetical protein